MRLSYIQTIINKKLLHGQYREAMALAVIKMMVFEIETTSNDIGEALIPIIQKTVTAFENFDTTMKASDLDE